MKKLLNILPKFLGASLLCVTLNAYAGEIELIQNGDFNSSGANWFVEDNLEGKTTTGQSWYGDAGKVIYSSHDDRDVTFDPSSDCINYWDLQLYQLVTLESGKEYTYSFDARSSGSGVGHRDLLFKVETNDGNYDLVYERNVSLTSSTPKGNFTNTFTSNYSGEVKVTFMGATESLKGYIDNVSLKTDDSSLPGGLKVNSGVYYTPDLPTCDESNMGMLTTVFVSQHTGGRYAPLVRKIVTCQMSMNTFNNLKTYDWHIMNSQTLTNYIENP